MLEQVADGGFDEGVAGVGQADGDGAAEAGDGARSTRPACSARAMRWETAPAVISVRRVISRVVSS